MAILSLCQFKDLTPTLILTIKPNINIFLWFMFRELQSPDEGSECIQLSRKLHCCLLAPKMSDAVVNRLNHTLTILKGGKRE